MSEHHSGECRKLIARFSRFIDGDLPARDRRAVLQHLRQCPCCDELVASLERTVRVCQEAGHAELPRAVRARALARIRALFAVSAPVPPSRGRTGRQSSSSARRRRR